MASVVADKPGLAPLGTQLEKLEKDVIAYAESLMTTEVVHSPTEFEPFARETSSAFPKKVNKSRQFGEDVIPTALKNAMIALNGVNKDWNSKHSSCTDEQKKEIDKMTQDCCIACIGVCGCDCKLPEGKSLKTTCHAEGDNTASAFGCTKGSQGWANTGPRMKTGGNTPCRRCLHLRTTTGGDRPSRR